ncbi:protein-glutamate methylesterase/protein-glutamine glutaminase [Neptunomonas marina]|uniref:Protein-glutamate methylesterase/protein-glutamine glutaminase n=1 Tax=Neptunomonas marina TaxID=1815562 RepID=A0A437Q7C7_9GAMM|nr:chemotaxis response regulator protein-glutamate methylesterase [Neptunomonas marina]RVU30283.1 chemotaxis response regulator protein-glutamate methylesterase [Neptunomonas marina]
MPIKVLIVDDSGFFRQRISDILSADSRLDVVGMASNGRQAVDMARQLKPDIITMDVEMPQLNGIEAVKIIMRESPTNVLMLSSLTHEGAQVTLQALDAGAADYLTKDIRAWIDQSNSMRNELVERVVALGGSKRFIRSSVFSQSRGASAQSSSIHTFKPEAATKAPARTTAPASSRSAPAPAPRRSSPAAGGAKFPDSCRIVLIGSSTGGPAALQKILMELPANFPLPILLIQHMPKTFTSVFAARLNQQCKIEVKEAEDGDQLKPGRALLAPGGQQLILDPRLHDRVKVLPGDERLTYRPSVDITYASAARAFGNRVLAITLTGMGADGADGARLLKQSGSTVWAQNEESCTIYGMPQAVVKAGLADSILHLDDIGRHLSARGKR